MSERPLLEAGPAFLVDFTFYLDVLVLEHLLHYAGRSSFEVALVFGVYTLAYAVLAPLLGKASDRGERRRSLLVGAAVFTLVPALLALNLELAPAAGEVSVRARALPLGPAAYLGIGVLALANGLFWPAIQARLGDRARTPRERARRIRRFNVAWTSGKACGVLVAAAWLVRSPSSVLPGAALLGSVVWLLVWLDRESPAAAATDASVDVLGGGGQPSAAPQVEAPPPSQAEKRPFLIAALVANFAVWAAVSTLVSLAPKVAERYGLSPWVSGVVLGACLGAQGVVFLVLGNASRWAYRWALLLAACPLAGLGLGLVAFADRLGFGALACVVGAGLVGTAQAVTYAASVFYALDYDERRGMRTGIHEATLALGGALPLAGGLLADAQGDVRAALLLGLGVCGVASLGVLLARVR